MHDFAQCGVGSSGPCVAPHVYPVWTAFLLVSEGCHVILGEIAGSTSWNFHGNEVSPETSASANEISP